MDKSEGGQCVTGNDGCILDLIRAFLENFWLKLLRQLFTVSCLTQIYCVSYRR
jgi:hypothetical protein